MKIGSHILLLAASIAWLSCNTTDPPSPPPPPPPPEMRIALSAEDVGVDDIVLKVSFPDSVPAHLTSLLRDATVIWNGVVSARDTIFVDSTLQVRTTYTYSAIAIRDSVDSVATSPVSVTTLDTTSHQFNYDIQSFGDFPPNAIYDVAILREDFAVAVGEIYLRDSLGGFDPLPYNYLQWDGSSWHLSKAAAVNNGNRIVPPLYGVSIVSENEIWVTCELIWRWDGQTWTSFDDDFLYGAWFGIRAISSSEIYFGSTQGIIAHHDGSSWHYTSHVSSTTVQDIWGMADGNMVAGGSNAQSVTGTVLKGRGSQWQKIVDGVNSTSIDSTELWRTKVYGMTSSVWCDERNTIYAAGIFLYKYKHGRWGFVSSLEGNYLGGNPGHIFWGSILSVRGNKSNDMVLFGEHGTALHYNGKTWKRVGPPYEPTSLSMWNCSATLGNLVIAGGNENGRATLMVMRR
jgi:hypothetical protein